MLTAMLRSAAGLGLAAGLAARLAAAPAEIPDYKIGDTVVADIVAPTRLVVVDAERTEHLRRQEAQRVQIYYLFNSNTVAEVDANFRQAFAEHRKRFIAELDLQLFRKNYNPQMLNGPRFEKFVATFQRQNKSFPLSTNLARLWARGESGNTLQNEWSATLRASASRYIRPDAMPAAAKFGPPLARVLAVGATNLAVDTAVFAQAGTNVNRTNLVAITKARQEMQNGFPPEQQAVGKFLAGFLRANCVCAEELTLRTRAQRVAPILAAAEFPPGQTIAKAGQRVDEKIKSALDQAKAHLVLARLREEAVRANQQLRAVNHRNHWLAGGLGAAVVAVVFLLWRVRRAARRPSLLPMLVSHAEDDLAVITCPSCEKHISVPKTQTGQTWRARALAAEQRAEQAGRLLRAGLLPKLARLLGERLVRGLIAQRSQMAEVQQQAAHEIEELEQRLQKIHAPLAERLRAYEQRIAELEQQLAAKNAEHRELLKVRIELTRQKLAAEHAKDPVGWN